MDFAFHVPTRIYFGRGAIDQLGTYTRAWGGNAMIVCGRSAMRSTGALDRALRSLAAAQVEANIYDRISANPRSGDVDLAIHQARASGADVIIGMGGGSALDAAKAVAVGMGHDSIGPLIGRTLEPSPHSLPVIAVPTTAGSGAEITKGAILTDVNRGLKSGIRGEDLFPRVAIIDPFLTETLPRQVALESGFDALAHAIEGLLAPRSSPINTHLAEQALRLIPPALRKIAAGDTHPDTRDTMAFAALLGGINVATAGTCLPHRMQQAMGTSERPGPSHGQGLAILYPAWLKSLEEHAADQLAQVAALLGGTDTHQEITRLLAAIGLRSTLRDFGYQPDDIPGFTARITGNIDNDPHTQLTTDLIASIYRHSL
jgi:alcohol dehydrogenase class IV